MSEAISRTPLTREKVLRAAMELADEGSLSSLTMRRLAERLGVEAMSLYHHIPGKNAILDGLIELAFDEIEQELGGFGTTADENTWVGELRDRILVARRVQLRHPWLMRVMEDRPEPGPTVIRHVDGIVSVMRAGGLSYDFIHHALHALGSRMHGFSQEYATDDGSPVTDEQLDRIRSLAPALADMLGIVAHDPDTTLGWCDDQEEFEFALDVLLEGLARRAERDGR